MTPQDKKQATDGETKEAKDSDELLFVDEDAPQQSILQPEEAADHPWRVLIVDDDEVVHSSTCYAFNNVMVFGRRLEFLHAYSAAEARTLLRSTRDLAIILLDVVMEEENSGLKLVHEIRETMQMHDVRIILRTGQPGYAPEIDAIRDLDINDYKTKSELTRSKLYATLTASARSYDQIRKLNASRRGLDMIVRGSAELIRIHGLKEFAAGVITQLASLLGLTAEGLVCAQETFDADGNPSYLVVAAAGRYNDLINRPVESIADEHLRYCLIDTLKQQKSHYSADSTTLYIKGDSGRDISVFLETPVLPSVIDRQLIEVFCSNISVCLDNVSLFSRLRNQAFFDQMLMLPNRLHFFEEIDAWIAAKRSGNRVIAIVDIDRFADINDALGHTYGDQLLQSIAIRLRGALGQGTMLARVGGDVFGIFGDQDHITPNFILSLFRSPFEVGDEKHLVSATLGLARLSDVDGDGSDAVKAANMALKRAQLQNRGSYYFFTREMALETRARVKLLRELRGAFECERLFLHFQPQIDLANGSLTGLEALIRWRSDAGAFVPPDDFIPLAENSGLIVSIGEWVLRAACLKAKQLHTSGHPHLRMAINVSVVQFHNPAFLDMLDQALAESGVAPETIELEITESVAMLEADYMIDILDKVKQRRVQVAVDDFGTGFSSLSYLRRLKLDRLKIDQSFIADLNREGEGNCIADMVIELGKSLGLQIIAEGVEEEWQALRLKEKGCDEAQGFFYAHPMDETTLAGWLSSRHQTL